MVNSVPRIDCLRIPDDAGETLRRRLSLATSEDLRISYIAGPGDVVGTYKQWQNGKTDSRVPVIAYSTMFYELVKRLEGKAQILCATEPPTTPSAPFNFVQLPNPDYNGRLKYRLSQTRRIRVALREVDKFQPHLIVASSDLPAAAWPALAQRAPLIPSLHNTFWPMGYPMTGMRGYLRYQVLQRQAKSVSAAVCTSKECARQISILTNRRIAGRVECPQILKSYAETPRHKARRLLYLGRIEDNKGIFLLLEAFVTVMRDQPETSLIFAGSGGSDTLLQRRINELETTRVQFLGSLSASDVHQTLSETDLLVCPTTTSFNEGLALVGFEAAAHGVPCVLSSIVPAKDLLKTCASVFPADDGAALKSCLAQLIENDAAYTELVQGTAGIRKMIYDRSQSWGSQLYLAMSDAADAL